MEEILKKYGISKQLFLKVTQFIKLQVDQKIVYTLTDQEQIAAEILIMASEGMNVKTGEKQCNLPVVNARTYDPDYEEVDCDHYEYQQMPDDADEVCHLGIGIENCAHCYKNKALYVR